MTIYPQADEKDFEQMDEIQTSPYKVVDRDKKKILLDGLKQREPNAKLLKFHKSLCPGCVSEEKFDQMLIDSVVYVVDNKVWIFKICKEHGVFKEIYWSDYGMYKKAEKFQDNGINLSCTQVDKDKINCPYDCGLCNKHESHTNLGNIALTNRCDLACWYCFFYAKDGENIYEPSLEQIRFMLKSLRDTKPVGANSCQFTGGEPTLRTDLIEIIEAAKEAGFDHVQLNTNGITLSKDLEFVKKIKKAGVSSLYMSFDGVTPETNPKNYWEAPRAIENCKQAGIGVVLVPTVISGINDHELGDIIRFGIGNMDVIRGINFQPISFVGMMPDRLRKKQRITIPSAIKKIEEQTDGEIGKEHWYTIPCAKAITDFIEAVKDQKKYRLSPHFTCGMVTYVFKDGEKIVPLPSFFDVDGFFEYIKEATDAINNSSMKALRKPMVLMKLLSKIGSFVDESKKPKDLKFTELLKGALGNSDYQSLGQFHSKAMLIGMMHFQDPYNWDMDRVHKCCIHYAVPDGRLIPFCTFNVIPELYRDKIQREFSISSKEWEERTGKKIGSDRHIRSLTQSDIDDVKESYDKYRKNLPKSTGSDWSDED
ncbi:MAG: radical SAM protein [Candidatus Aenigmatarchaeota archaeon]